MIKSKLPIHKVEGRHFSFVAIVAVIEHHPQVDNRCTTHMRTVGVLRHNIGKIAHNIPSKKVKQTQLEHRVL